MKILLLCNENITILIMNTINQTDLFKHWLHALKDLRAKAQILQRIKRAQQGHFGDYRVLGDGICEMKIDIGQGYRVYYARQGNTLYLLLLGGDKSSQRADIQAAKQYWQSIQQENL